jgi:D-sedoheptulose 7-phosphate isomerase
MKDQLTDYVETYLDEAAEISRRLSRLDIAQIVEELAAVRRVGGRLFILGVGGSAASSSRPAIL